LKKSGLYFIFLLNYSSPGVYCYHSEWAGGCLGEQLSAEDLEALRFKKNGGKRLLICYMSIGEAEDYRFYWQEDWSMRPPSFLCDENPEWEGNFKVKYWYPSWQKIIYGPDGYLSKIIASGFDGVYLDIIDAFEYFL